jgi:ring-1,2-phenylacetyl-CoA epoxidase subunit PaaC
MPTTVLDLPAFSAGQTALLRIADTSLIHSQRLSQWSGHAPMLEEDLALSNIALDLLGQARMLYQHLASLEISTGRDEDWYAYFRVERQFYNHTLAELPNGLTLSSGPRDDYAVTLTKLFLSSAYFLPYWSALCRSPYEALAQIAQKCVKEARYHWEHAAQWMVRMGDGTQESNERAQAALNRLWPYCNEMLSDDAIDLAAKTDFTVALPSELAKSWAELVNPVLEQAQLLRPSASKMLSQGKRGEHSEAMGLLLAEMQTLARQHPGAAW